MSRAPLWPEDSTPGPLGEVRAVYGRLLDSWNRRDGEGFAALFAEDGSTIGFDGSQMNGRAEIADTLRRIFADHQTAAYLAIVREVRMLSENAALLRAVAGMTPAGGSGINPAVNAVQSLVAVQQDGWRIALLQTTPAAFHGRPDLAERLTAELEQALRARSSGG